MKEAASLVDTVFGFMKEALKNGDNLKISGFGTFTVKQKAARKGRNPQTGEEIIVSRRRVISYKPSTVLKQKINAAE